MGKSLILLLLRFRIFKDEVMILLYSDGGNFLILFLFKISLDNVDNFVILYGIFLIWLL